MNEDEFQALRARFLRAFASVALKLRHEIIAVIDDKPISWTAAYAEIERGTPEGRKILERLNTLGVLKDDPT